MATFEERIARFRDRWIRPDVLKVARGRRAYLERRRSMPARNTLSRLLVLARNLASGDYVRYGSFPKSDLLADLRGDLRPPGAWRPVPRGQAGQAVRRS